MAVQTETYKARLLANYNSLYLLLGLMEDGKSDIPLYDFLVDSKSRFREYYGDKSKFSDNNLRLEASVAEVSKLSESCSFSYVRLLDFDVYERVDYLLNLLLAYQDINSITEFMQNEIKELIEYMTLMERTNGSLFKKTLSYMTIRNFLMLLVNKKFLHASVYATFLKEQIFLSEGLSPKVRFSDLYKGELGLAIIKGRATYSAKIRRNLKKQIRDISQKSTDESTKGSNSSSNKNPSKSTNVIKKSIYGVNSNAKKINFTGNVICVRDSFSKSKVSLPRLKKYIEDMIEERGDLESSESDYTGTSIPLPSNIFDTKSKGK